MLARRLPALLVIVLVLLPTAGAFASRHDAVELAYAAVKGPVVLGIGNLTVEGQARGAVLAAQVGVVSFENVPTLTLLEQGQDGLPRNTTVPHATLSIETGSLIWRLPPGGARVDAWADYGFGLALADAPVPSDDGSSVGAGALVASPRFAGTAQMASGAADVVPLHATVSVYGADGKPLAGWLHRAINANATAQNAAGTSGFDALFHLEGATRALFAARVVGFGTGDAANMTLSVRPGSKDEFAGTLDVLSTLSSELGGEGKDSAFGKDNPLEQLAIASPMLNGAMLVINNDGQGNGTEPPRTAKMGADPLETGPVTFLRGSGSAPMKVRWEQDEMRVEGAPALAVTKAGFAVQNAATIGIVPVISVVLWIGALVAIVIFFVKRPPQGDGPFWLRLVGWASWLLVLLAVFVVWDMSFADSFGTSALAQFRAGSRDWTQLGVTLSLELVPWSFAALLFALPVRIMLGVGLRYVGKGKTLKSFATAGGLVALGILGPLYALYIVNVGIQQALAAMSGL